MMAQGSEGISQKYGPDWGAAAGEETSALMMDLRNQAGEGWYVLLKLSGYRKRLPQL
jgi:hypothetical protein